MDSFRPSALTAPTTRPAEDDRSLERRQVELALRGDAHAFREIVERHHRGIHSLVHRMVGDRHDTEDLVQETFAKAYRALGDFDPHYRFSTWLYRIALNSCRDHLKSPRRAERPAGTIPAESHHPQEDRPDAEGMMVAAQRADRVRQAIDRLPDAYREVLILKDLQDLSYQEIQAITGGAITALKIRVVRARARLRALLEQEPA